MSTFAYILITDSESCTVRMWTRWGDPESVFPKLLTCLRELTLAMPEKDADNEEKVGRLRDLLIGASALSAPLTQDIGFRGPLRSYHFGSRGDAEWVYVLDTSRDVLFFFDIEAGDLAWRRCRARIGELLRTEVVCPWKQGLKTPGLTIEAEEDARWFEMRMNQAVAPIISQLQECGWAVNPDGGKLFVDAPQSSAGTEGSDIAPQGEEEPIDDLSQFSLVGFEFPPQRDWPRSEAFPQRGVVVPLEEFLDAVDLLGDVRYWRDRFYQEHAVARGDELLVDWGEDDNGQPTVRSKDLPWGELPANGWSWKILGTTDYWSPRDSAESEENPAKMKLGVTQIFEAIYVACLRHGYSTHETSAKLGRLLQRIQPDDCAGLPEIVAVRPFRSRESGNDNGRDCFCVVFDADRCFRRVLSKEGSTLTGLLGREVNAGSWVDWDCDDWLARQQYVAGSLGDTPDWAL